MKKCKINGVPFLYIEEEDEFIPRYFWSNFALSSTNYVKGFISFFTGFENTFQIEFEPEDEENS